MHILLLSASDHNSSRILQSALSRNFTVTFLTPHSAYTRHHPNVTLINGLPASQHHLEDALQTPTYPEAVILAFYNTHVLEAVATTLLSALKAVNIREQAKTEVPISLPLRLVFIQSNTTQLESDSRKRIDTLIHESGLPFVLSQCPRLARELPAIIRASPGDGRSDTWLAALKST
ncbi:hypothetical protein F53441_4079 [Fusarium austroafricanum]|uniref:NAD(P)-binding domain-containing protein n=1 Tax=Fusarium austroafricanum TaxID=2364996 RepID=A0A8H4KNP0_9HYPO|nr:hypothetical protein F53441_4079 [Fusarium austroafricanum]